MALLKKKDYLKFNKYSPLFQKIDMDALMADIDSRIDNVEAGIVPEGSVSLAELEAGVQASVAKADTSIQPGVANDIIDIAIPATATAEDVANKVNEMLAAMRSLGLLNS
jgi:hypothetical protein